MNPIIAQIKALKRELAEAGVTFEEYISYMRLIMNLPKPSPNEVKTAKDISISKINEITEKFRKERGINPEEGV